MMVHEHAIDDTTSLRRTVSHPGGSARSPPPVVPSPDAPKHCAMAPAAQQMDDELKSPAATLLKYLFTPSFFKDVWEQAPLVVPHSALPHNPFVGHRWITEEEMICMCYRAAVAGTLKIFRRGVAHPPPSMPLPSPLPNLPRGDAPRSGTLSSSKNAPVVGGETGGNYGSTKTDDSRVNGESCANISRPFLCVGSSSAAPVVPPDEELLGGLTNHGTTEPGSSHLLECVGPYLDGCSLVLNQADRTHPGLQELCRILAQQLFTHVFAVAYLTPPSSYAVDIHTDDQDVFLIQLWGQKHWKVYAPPQALPLSEETLGKKEPFRKDPGHPVLHPILEEGDILYIPRGFPHEALTTTQNSLHITVTVPTAEYAYINALNRFLRNLVLEHKLGDATEKYCRAALLFKTKNASDQSSDAGDSAKKATDDIVSLLKYEAVMDSLQDHLDKINAMQTAQFKRLQSIPAKPLITQSSLVRLYPGIRCTCEEGSAEASFFRSGQRLKMNIYPSASMMIHQLATAHTLVEVSKLRCSDGFERLGVLLVLLRKGLIEVVEEK